MAAPSRQPHLVPFRGMLHAGGCTLEGRVLRGALGGGPQSNDSWWRNLRSSWRRFDSEPIPGVEVELEFLGERAMATSDAEGYYSLTLPVPDASSEALWQIATARPAGHRKVFLQPVLCVPAKANFGVISDMDDTVIESSLVHWQTALQLAFLHNARTRKPLEGVAGLYQAMQQGKDEAGPNPVFYVSASPWNLYDMLEDFLALNAIPPGPLLLRDVDFSRVSLGHGAQSQSKIDNIRLLMQRYPGLQWLLVGDSGQLDAELYAGIVLEHPGRVLAVYIRDVDPVLDSPRDRYVDGHIERIAGSGVPMLRVRDSNAIAEHARGLGLLAPAQLPAVAAEVRKDQARPRQDGPLKTGTVEAAKQVLGPAGR